MRAPTIETCLQAILPDYPVISDQKSTLTSAGNEIFNIAPGESRHPVSMMNDKQCEDLAFTILFPEGRFGHKEERTVKLSPSKDVKTQLLHYSSRFAMNPEYLVFAQFILE